MSSFLIPPFPKTLDMKNKDVQAWIRAINRAFAGITIPTGGLISGGGSLLNLSSLSFTTNKIVVHNDAVICHDGEVVYL